MKEKIPIGLLLMAIFIKLSWFYNVTSVTNNFLPVVITTFVLYSSLILLLSKRPWLSLTVACIITFIFEGEVLYFRYFNKLLSFYNLTQVQFVDSVADIMFGLIRPVDIILLLDIVVLFLILYKKKDYLHLQTKFKFVTIAMLVVLIPSLTLASFGNEFGKSVMNQEFFMYHTKDGIEVYQSEVIKEDVVYSEPEPIEVVEETIIVKEYTGIFEGKNLITIQVESLQDMMLLKEYNNQEITPFLNSLIAKDSFYFSSYFQQLGKGNTSDSEFSSHNSLYPSMEGISYMRYQNSDFKGLPVLLSERGYNTMAFHGNEASFWYREEAYPKQGIHEFHSEEKLIIDEVIGMGLSDESLYRQSIDVLKEQVNPFYAFIVTLTNHNPYEIPADKITIDLLEEDEGKLFGNYIESVRYTDETIEQFYKDLELEGLLEDTVIMIYGDHHGIVCMDDMYQKRITSFLGYEYDFDEMMNIPLIIHAPGSGISSVLDNTFDQQDLLPTLVNLYGVEDELKMMGQDMLNTEDYFALFQTYMVTGSFIWDDTVFEMSRDGIFENGRAWNRKTKEPVDVEDCREGYNRALYELELSKYILENNKVLIEKDILDDTIN